MNKLQSYLGIARKANFLIIGSDNLKDYHKKLYLVICSKNLSNTIEKVIKEKTTEYQNLICIISNEDFSSSIGVNECKIVGVKNKGIADAIIKSEDCYTLYNISK